MAKPTVYDELYPGRFLKAGLLKGQKVTLTLKDVDLEGLEGDDGKKQQKAILSFEERPMQLVMCKTNGYCIKSMFGPTLATWIGKRVTLFESQWNGEPCIRIWGSPDLTADMKVTVSLPRRRPFDMLMHAVKANKVASVVSGKSDNLDPRITAAFAILGWDDKQQAEYLADNAALGQSDMAKDLNRLIEERDSDQGNVN
jgi:hypothetical protein